MRQRSKESGSSPRLERMRSGGPRLLCSPYFVIVLFVLLIFVSMKYYSIGTDNETLLLRIEVLQNQMKMTASNLKSLDATLSKKNEALLDCNNQKIETEGKVKRLEDENRNKEELINRLKDDISNRQKNLDKLQTENVNLNMANDTITDSIKKLNQELQFVKQKNEELEKSRNDCIANEEKINRLQEELDSTKNELNSLRGEKIEGKDQISIPDSGEKYFNPKLGDGQLPDVNPAAVQVKEPGLHGNSYHKDDKGNYLPILPRGDPNGPRAKPRFSVGDIVSMNSKQEVLKRTSGDETQISQQDAKDHDSINKPDALAPVLKAPNQKPVIPGPNIHQKSPIKDALGGKNEELVTSQNGSDLKDKAVDLEDSNNVSKKNNILMKPMLKKEKTEDADGDEMEEYISANKAKEEIDENQKENQIENQGEKQGENQDDDPDRFKVNIKMEK